MKMKECENGAVCGVVSPFIHFKSHIVCMNYMNN